LLWWLVLAVVWCVEAAAVLLAVLFGIVDVAAWASGRLRRAPKGGGAT